MRRFVIGILVLINTLPALAQVGNEWIQFNQQYFKIPVGKDGIYRLTQANLQAAGLPPSLDPRTLKLFHRGIEHAIYVEGQNDGQFNPSDFVEFYGQHNDGTLDAELYNPPSAQPHKFYNLYNDTTSYFLTFGSTSGKRIQLSSEINPGLSPEIFHWDQKLLVLKDQYSGGIDYGEIQNSTFENGEGWMGSQILQTQTGSYVLEGITQGVVAGGQPILEVQLTGRGPMNHVVEIYAGARLVKTVNFSAFASVVTSESLLWSDIGGDGKLTINVKVIGIGGAPDRASLGYLKLRYPQQVDMASALERVFTLSENNTDLSYIEIKNPLAGTRVFDVSDPANVLQIAVAQTTTLNAVVASTRSARKLLATSIKLTPSVRRIFFRNINPATHNFVIVTHPLLRKPTSGYTDPVKAYAEYRALPEGGGYDTLVINIQQLYDQFSYGEQTPVAVFRFIRYLNATNTPQYLFLIGKGLEVNHGYYRNPGAFPVFKDLVPTAGYPASDLLFSAVNGSLPTVATGRLSASSAQEVAAYFNKVKEREGLPFDDLRRKNILHLSGGIFPGEPQTFRAYLEDFARVAEGYHFGGHVNAIAKQSTDLETINVAAEVNKGLNMITFFGHSAPGSSDFDIGFVTDPVMGYNNKNGKYPLILMNGCSAGSFFLNASIFGENWTNTPGRGAIGIIAHSSFGFPNALQRYSSLFYEIGFHDPAFINLGIGDVQKELAKRYLNNFGVSPVSTTQVQQMVLLGDPAVKLFGAKNPDYEIVPNTLSVNSFDGEPVTALTDSFKLNFVVHNYGQALDQTYKVEVTRILTDNSSIHYDSVFSGILYSDTIRFVLPGKVENGFGNNSFSIKIDADDTIEELREDNNTASFSFFIPLSGTKNLYPDNYAIVHSTQMNLTFQHTDQLVGKREFLLELDTLPDFSSSFKQQFQISGNVLATKNITLAETDTLTYYWRTKLANPSADESVEWDLSSFTFIKDGPTGWAQVHFPQYDENPSAGLVKDPLLRNLKFKETVSEIAVKTFGAAAGKPRDSVSVKINGVEYNLYSELGGAFGCRINTINFIAFDKKTTQPYPGIYLTFQDIFNTYGGRSLLCGREPYVINSFKADELTAGTGADLINYVDNISLGDSVVLFNIGDADYATWPAAAKNKLGEIGISVSQIDNLLPGEPVIILARKGISPGMAIIHKPSDAPANTKKLSLLKTITGRVTSGTMTSGMIGPAQKWEKFDVTYSEIDLSDVTTFDIIGIRSDGTQGILRSDITGDDDLSSIDAGEFPYLKISFKAADETFVTPAQLHHWIVIFQPVAEGVLLYRGENAQESLFEGEVWNGDYNFVNISNETFGDSLQVKYTIQNPETFISATQNLKIKPPAPGDTTRFSVAVATISQDGVNNVEVFVNPRIITERDYDNNLIILYNHLNVITDGSAPVLDVTIDGRHPARGEFISPSPDIRIMLWDNNPYLLKSDTTAMTLLLSYPCESEDCDFARIYFSDATVTWHAETDTSEFRVNLKPVNLPDGSYTLRVGGSDVNGNPSGSSLYEIIFQVRNETTLVVAHPYPNPFNGEVHFEFDVTGKTLPSTFQLEILTLSGKPVRTFSESDVSDFHIGKNTISWSAMDQQSNPLPNGIYIFRFTIRVEDQTRTAIGKIVLVR